MRRHHLATLVGALALTSALASCSSQAESTAEGPAPGAQDGDGAPAAPGAGAADDSNGTVTEAAPALDGRAVVDFFGFVQYRYQEFPETETLAEIAPTDAGVTGTIVGYREGPQYFEDGGPDSGANVVMTVRLQETFEGETPRENSVEILLPSANGQTPADFGDVLPAGTSLVLYLAPATDLPPGGSAGLMVPVSPQGFVAALNGPAEDGIVYPLDHEIVASESLEDQVPPEG